MATCPLPTVETIHDTFVSEITQLGGRVTDDYRYNELLLLRSVLPHSECVRPQDAVQGGVALRATEHEIFVHPYTFRKVCQNGAVMAMVLDTAPYGASRFRRFTGASGRGTGGSVHSSAGLWAEGDACGSVHAMQQASNLVLDQHTATSLLMMLPSAKFLGRRFIHGDHGALCSRW